MVATALDTFYKTNTTLSGGNLVATSTGAGGARTNRAISGLTYFEVTPTTLTGTPSVGIVQSNWNTSTALQSGTNTLGYLATGAVQINGTTLATIATWAQGNRIDVAVDPRNKLIWFRVAGGNWNNNVANDPVAEVGGIDFSSIIEGTIDAAVAASVTGNVWTTVFSTASFAGVPPTGYTSMDTINFAAVKSVVNATEIPALVSPAAFIGASVMPADGSTRGKHFSPAGALTAVSGTTTEGGVVVAGRKVEVYDRITGELLGSTFSDGSGNWSITCLGRPNVRVVGSDPTTYNSIVYDNVVPV